MLDGAVALLGRTRRHAVRNPREAQHDVTKLIGDHRIEIDRRGRAVAVVVGFQAEHPVDGEKQALPIDRDHRKAAGLGRFREV